MLLLKRCPFTGRFSCLSSTWSEQPFFMGLH